MMELIEDVFIRCGRCGKEIGIHKEDFDFESYVYDRGENRMGEEIEYRHDGDIECKRYGRQNSVGVNIVRSLYGVQSADRINKAILVTTGHVTRGVRRGVETQRGSISCSAPGFKNRQF